MKLIKAPPAPILIRFASWVVALVVGGGIAWLVLNFGYYASGLAVFNEDQRRRRATPIPVSFSDPNTSAPATDPNY